MRKSFLAVLITLLSIFTISACAPSSSQSSSYSPISAEERANKAIGDYTSNLNLTAAQKKSFLKIFANFYKSMDALRQPGVQPEKNEIDKIWSQRNAALQEMMTAEQFKGFKEAEDAFFRKNRIPAEERANKAMFDYTSNLNLTAEQKKSFQRILISFYNSMDTLYKPGIQAEKSELDQLYAKRNAALQEMMTAEQFKGFKEAEDAFFKKQEGRRRMQ
jgi:hypothetical protein